MMVDKSNKYGSLKAVTSIDSRCSLTDLIAEFEPEEEKDYDPTDSTEIEVKLLVPPK